MHFQIARQNQWNQNLDMHNCVFSSQRRGFGPTQSRNSNTRVPRNSEFQSPILPIPNDVDSKATSQVVLTKLICQICFKKGQTRSWTWERYNEGNQVLDLQIV